MAGKSRYVMILFCLCSIGLASSLPKAVAQSDSPFKLRVDVDLTTIEVVAMDKKGKPVHNLKKEDFQLYEDGKQQEILSIDEVNAESGTSSLGASPIGENASPRGKIVFIVFDDSSIAPQYIKDSRDSALKFVKEHMRPQDLFAIAVNGMSMKIIQNFTTDRTEVLEAIGRAAAINAGGGSAYFEDLLRSLDGVNNSIALLKGQKSILIYSQFSSSVQDSVTMSSRSLSQVSGTLPATYARTLLSARKSDALFHIIDPGALNMNAPQGMSLRSLAAESGGSSINSHLDAELDLLDQRISNYYLLGFQSNNPKRDSSFRKLEVRTELKGVNLKHQEGYTDKRPVDVLASARQEKALLTALASPENPARLPIIFRPIYFYDSSRTARVLVATRIRMEKTTFRKKGGQIGTDLNIMGVAYAENGSIAARFSETLPAFIDKEKEAEFRKRDYVYRNYFKLRPGKYRLKLAVSDESDNLGAMEQSLEIPVFPDKGFGGSSIVIAEQTSRLPDLIRNLQTQLLDESNPLLFSGLQIEPSVENRLPVNSLIPLIFRIYNLTGASDQWNVTAKARLLDEKGKEYALGPMSLKKAMSPVGGSEAVVVLGLSFQNVPAGKYRFIIEISEAASAETAALQTDLEFIK